MARRRGRWFAALVVGASVAGACGVASESAPTSAVPWLEATARIEQLPTPADEVESGVRPLLFESIVWTEDGYLAAGADGVPVAIWRSDDGVDWTLLADLGHGCCDRYEHSARLHRFGDRVLLVTGGELRPDPEADTVGAGFLRSSIDGGATWVDHDSGPFEVPGLAFDDLMVAGDAVIVTSRTETGAHEPHQSLWRSTDLEQWTELALSGAPEGFRTPMAIDGRVLLVVATGARSSDRHWYRSTDGGDTFRAVQSPDEQLRWPMGMVGDWLLAPVQAAYGADNVQTGPVLLATADGERWTALDRNTGLWGDGPIDPGVMAATRSGAYVAVRRVMREDDRYCFDDVATCEQRDVALVHVDHDLRFRQVAVELPAHRALVAGGDGSLLLWGERHPDEPWEIAIQRWDGPEAPPLLPEPEPLPPPSDASPVLGWDLSSVEVGERFRVQLGLGGCGGHVVEADGRRFVDPDPPRPPYPDPWRVRYVDVADGPGTYLFATGERTDAATFVFDPGDGSTLTYQETSAPPGPSCG